jgi:GNAT superfamily N-acetyltransferase
MRAAATGGTSLAVVNADGRLAAVCANYVADQAPPTFPAAVGTIAVLLSALYAVPLAEVGAEDTLDVGILAVDERFARQGLANHLVQATVACAAAAGFRALTTGATSASQDLFAACNFQSRASVAYAGFEHDGIQPFANIAPFSRRFSAPAAHLMVRQLGHTAENAPAR